MTHEFAVVGWRECGVTGFIEAVCPRCGVQVAALCFVTPAICPRCGFSEPTNLLRARLSAREERERKQEDEQM